MRLPRAAARKEGKKGVEKKDGTSAAAAAGAAVTEIAGLAFSRLCELLLVRRRLFSCTPLRDLARGGWPIDKLMGS